MVLNNKRLNNLNYNKTITLLEYHYFREQLERFQTLFTVYKMNTMYLGTFTLKPDKNWLHDPVRNPSIIVQHIINSKSISLVGDSKFLKKILHMMTQKML